MSHHTHYHPHLAVFALVVLGIAWAVTWAVIAW